MKEVIVKDINRENFAKKILEVEETLLENTIKVNMGSDTNVNGLFKKISEDFLKPDLKENKLGLSDYIPNKYFLLES